LTGTTRQFAADTHSGLHRSLNEDCYEADPDLGLWLVADGVGGHSCGEVASNIVRATIHELIAKGEPLLETVYASHAAVLDAAKKGQGADGMGTTVVAAQLEGDQYEVVWVGDSRAYIYNGELRQITQDHNRAGELLANDVITAEQASSHPERHVLTQSLGVSVNMDLNPGYQKGTLAPDEHLLLCSDGLTDELSDSLIQHLLTQHKTPRAQVDALVSAALDAGGRDNITVVVISPPTAANGSEARDLESTHNIRRSASGGKPNDARFPLRALLLISVIALLAVILLL
jgi:PPM family protein phosphatase